MICKHSHWRTLHTTCERWFQNQRISSNFMQHYKTVELAITWVNISTTTYWIHPLNKLLIINRYSTKAVIMLSVQEIKMTYKIQCYNSNHVCSSQAPYLLHYTSNLPLRQMSCNCRPTWRRCTLDICSLCPRVRCPPLATAFAYYCRVSCCPVDA